MYWLVRQINKKLFKGAANLHNFMVLFMGLVMIIILNKVDYIWVEAMVVVDIAIVVADRLITKCNEEFITKT